MANNLSTFLSKITNMTLIINYKALISRREMSYNQNFI